MKSAILTGVTGQDGSYLAELLVSKGYQVTGTTRDKSKAIRSLPDSIKSNINLIELDLGSLTAIKNLLADIRPHEVYNFAAFSSGASMFENPLEIVDINGVAVTRILEAIRSVDPKIRLCQASSREIFGDSVEYPQTENTYTSPRSPYGAAKQYADSMIRIYRKNWKIYACSAILYNHESPRRGSNFVTRKITQGVAQIKLGLMQNLSLGNLDTNRDWGFAGDYIEGMWRMLQLPSPEDFIFSSEENHSIREFCEIAFQYVGLDYQKYVIFDSLSYRPSEETLLVGDATKAKAILGWSRKVTFDEMVRMMVQADLDALQK